MDDGRVSGPFLAPANQKGPNVLNVTETARRFFQFFGDRDHQPIPGGSRVPPDGGPVLFTTSGMHSLTRYLEGKVLAQLGPGQPLTSGTCTIRMACRPSW